MAEPFQAHPYARSPFDDRAFLRSESLVAPMAVYALYILTLFTGGLSMILGVVIAYVLKDEAGPVARSHYVFQIRTFWWGLAFIPLGILLVIVGIPLMLVVVGFPIMLLGGLMVAGAHLWQVIRCVVGLVRAAAGDGYPNPRTLLV